MYYLHTIKSLKDDKIYIRSTNNLRGRLFEHNSGKELSTKGLTPFELRYYEAYRKQEDAQHREYSLKKDGRSLAQLKKRIQKSLQ